MITESPRTASHVQVQATLSRVGTDPKLIAEILADYPDPIDLTEAEPALLEKYGITQGLLMDRMGGSP